MWVRADTPFVALLIYAPQAPRIRAAVVTLAPMCQLRRSSQNHTNCRQHLAIVLNRSYPFLAMPRHSPTDRRQSPPSITSRRTVAFLRNHFGRRETEKTILLIFSFFKNEQRQTSIQLCLVLGNRQVRIPHVQSCRQLGAIPS
jgi:hypothetical protein